MPECKGQKKSKNIILLIGVGWWKPRERESIPINIQKDCYPLKPKGKLISEPMQSHKHSRVNGSLNEFECPHTLHRLIYSKCMHQ